LPRNNAYWNFILTREKFIETNNIKENCKISIQKKLSKNKKRRVKEKSNRKEN